MLKNRQIYQTPPKDSISVESNFETDKIWTFIDVNIISFPSYFQSITDSEKEDRITDFIIHFFQGRKNIESDGYAPYDFRPQPTQKKSNRKPDIGVYLRAGIPVTVIEIEAKILSSKSTHNKEYVCGETGGIERFKRGLHSSHLTECGMFGYIQTNDADHWITKINNWIAELSDKNAEWTKDEILQKSDSFSDSNVSKYHSRHHRLSLSEIVLYHYFIDLSTALP